MNRVVKNVISKKEALQLDPLKHYRFYNGPNVVRNTLLLAVKKR